MRASRPHSTDTLAPGQRIGPFVLLAPLGVGGSGRIWAVARIGQLGFNKRMVLKVMRQDKLASERARERFDREACLGGRLSHEGVRAVHDLGSHEGAPFMAMSWVDTSLDELLEHAPGRALPPEVVCWIGMQCCSALRAAHEFVDSDGERQPIVHRDVSPGNILLTADGHALLADVTAPAAGADASPRESAGTRFFGSLAYAAPEALRQEPLDGRADIFSLGAVLFEALTGSPAFEGDDERRVVFQILEGSPPELTRLVPAIPDDLAEVVRRCLERRPELRFQTASELRAALSACCKRQSAFNLEQRAAGLMREVLGGLIRDREEALHLAFQRFAPSPFERTDTLPIVSAADRSLQIPTPEATSTTRSSERDVSRSGAGMALSGRRRAGRRPLWVAAGLVAPLVLYGLWSSRPEAATTPSVRADVDDGSTTAAPREPAVAPAQAAPPQRPAVAPSPSEATSAAGGAGPAPNGVGLAQGAGLATESAHSQAKARLERGERARASRSARRELPLSAPAGGGLGPSPRAPVHFDDEDLDNPYDEAPASTKNGNGVGAR